MRQKSRFNARTLALIGVLSALVFALSSISIPIGELSRIHFGNIMCLLSGMLFGPMVGGLSSGFGSMLYDFTNPLYVSEFWITFITKFAMGFVAGLVSRRTDGRLPRLAGYALAGSAGAALYVALYLVKSTLMLHYVNGNPWPAVWPVVAGKGVISGINAIIAVVASTLLAPVLHRALASSGLLRTLAGTGPAQNGGAGQQGQHRQRP